MTALIITRKVVEAVQNLSKKQHHDDDKNGKQTKYGESNAN
jgi:hypothetical protein